MGQNLNPEQLKLLLKPYSNGAYPQEIGRCPVVIEYQNQEGSAEIKLGDNWVVAPHENLIFDLKKSFQDDTQNHYGFLAQEIVETALADSVSGDEGEMGMNYSELIAPIVKAIQELSDKINALEGN